MVTRMYDDALRPVNLRTTQFSVLSYLIQNGDMRVRDLSEGLLLEETTLTRNLRPLEQHGWVTLRAGTDRREKYVSVTRAGRAVITKAAPLWESVQERLRQRVSATTWDAAFRSLPEIAAGASPV
ncbi:MarR family winged helix-turn-helix transcriptional regulator [Myxococcus eversor]|nr:MarR family winged helix-turn-helix transcriptional regulator [Myxococcus eversor]